MNGQSVPLTLDGVKAQYMAGQITGETMIFRKGLNQWVKCRELDELEDLFVSSEEPPPPPSE